MVAVTETQRNYRHKLPIAGPDGVLDILVREVCCRQT